MDESRTVGDLLVKAKDAAVRLDTCLAHAAWLSANAPMSPIARQCLVGTLADAFRHATTARDELAGMFQNRPALGAGATVAAFRALNVSALDASGEPRRSEDVLREMLAAIEVQP